MYQPTPQQRAAAAAASKGVAGAAPSTAAATSQNPGVNAYLRARVLTASPEELRLMLLDGAIKFATQGREGLAAKDFEKSFTGISQARDIVFELLSTIKDEPNPELAQQVRGLYTFIYKLLIEASFEKDVAKADTAIELLGYERETWTMLMQQLAAERGGSKAPAAGNATPGGDQAIIQKAGPGTGVTAGTIAPARPAASVQAGMPRAPISLSA